MVHKTIVSGISPEVTQEVTRYIFCVYEKGTRSKIPTERVSIAERIIDVIKTYVCGKFPVQTKTGSPYFVNFIDN